MTLAWTDYYRCPEEFANFGISQELGKTPGFFQFGQRITCFGRCAGPVAQSPGGNLSDVLPMAQVCGAEITLPFDPDEIVENLRREKYVAEGKGHSPGNKLVRKAYYALRPLLSVGIRKHFQRFHLRRWKDIVFPSWPVDKTIENLCGDLMALRVRANQNQRVPFIWFWPDGHKGCAIMTHDVEHEPGRAFCGAVMDLDDRYGIRSSFQLVPERRYALSDAFLENMRARGFELNVHDLNHDGQLFENREQFLKRAAEINAHARRMGAEGFRSGAMYRNADWSDALHFTYDMSVPNAAHLEPQKGGCCTIMPYFAGGMVELPLTMTQDYSLFHMLGQYSTDLWKEELQSVLSSYGLAGFIVHPDYVIEKRARRVYENLLGYLAELCSQKNLWQPLPRDVAHWWRDRSQMEVVRSGNSWKVVGPGSERARLAFAQIEEGQLAYHVEDSPVSANAA